MHESQQSQSWNMWPINKQSLDSLTKLTLNVTTGKWFLITHWIMIQQHHPKQMQSESKTFYLFFETGTLALSSEQC